MSFPQSLGESGQPPDKAPTTEQRASEGGWDRSALFRLALLWLIGANLRMAVLALPPLLPEIQHQLGLSETAVGALTSLPVLLLALASVLGSIAVAHLGPRLALVLGLLVVGVASGARGFGGVVGLFGASVALGLGIAVLQPTMPSIASAWFPSRVSFATSLYSNGIVTGEALAASLTLALVVPLSGSWQRALAVWGLPAFVAAGLLGARFAKVPVKVPDGPVRWWPGWTDAITWRAGLLQGGTSAVYFGTNAFLATQLHAVGHPGLVGPCLAALNTAQLAASFIVAYAARRGPGLTTCWPSAQLVPSPAWPASSSRPGRWRSRGRRWSASARRWRSSWPWHCRRSSLATMTRTGWPLACRGSATCSLSCSRCWAASPGRSPVTPGRRSSPRWWVPACSGP